MVRPCERSIAFAALRRTIQWTGHLDRELDSKDQTPVSLRLSQSHGSFLGHLRCQDQRYRNSDTQVLSVWSAAPEIPDFGHTRSIPGPFDPRTLGYPPKPPRRNGPSAWLQRRVRSLASFAASQVAYQEDLLALIKQGNRTRRIAQRTVRGSGRGGGSHIRDCKRSCFAVSGVACVTQSEKDIG